MYIIVSMCANIVSAWEGEAEDWVHPKHSYTIFKTI